LSPLPCGRAACARFPLSGEFISGGSWRLAQRLGHTHLPAHFRGDGFPRHARIELDKLHFPLRIGKIKEGFVGDHQLWSLAWYPELGGGAPLQMTRCGEKVEMFDKSPLFEVHDDVHPLRVDGNLAGTSTARQ